MLTIKTLQRPAGLSPLHDVGIILRYTSENQRFSSVFRGSQMEALGRNGLTHLNK